MIGQYHPDQFLNSQRRGVRSLLSGLPSFDLSPEVTDAYFNDTVKAPLLRSFDRDIAPRIAEGFAGVGAFSSRAGIARANALGDLTTSLAAERSRLAYQDQALAAQLAESAVGRIPIGLQAATQVANQPLSSAGALMGVANPFQVRADQLLSAQQEQFYTSQPYNNPYIQQALGFIGQQQMAAYNPQRVGGLGGLLGGLAGGAAVGNALGGLGITGIQPALAPLGAVAGLFGLLG